MKTAPPVRPLRKHEREYERLIKDNILAPLQRGIQARLNRSALRPGAWNRAVLEAFEAFNPWLDFVPRAMDTLRKYHTERAIVSLSRAFGIDVRPFAPDMGIRSAMRRNLATNINLIKSIPTTLQGQVFGEFDRIFTEVGFDQQALVNSLTKRFDVAGARAKFIARDQTSKIIGDLSRIRNQQLGIKRYVWETSDDERVRDSHEVLDGTTQTWDNPPEVGHPGEDFQCRCTARPIIE